MKFYSYSSEETTMTKVIVVDDQTMFRECVSNFLVNRNLANVLAEASNGKELLKLLENYSPDLVLMDIVMPEMDGIEATKKAIEKQPNIKILVLSAYGNEQYYYNMIQAGAKGFIMKNSPISELEEAIKEIVAGGSWFSSDMLQKVILKIGAKPQKRDPSELTSREIEIIKLICKNNNNNQIANKINISYDTVKWHRANILSKTGCNNAISLLIYAIKNKIIDI